MERIRDKANAERYDRMIAKREEQITEAKKQIEELQNISEMLRSRQHPSVTIWISSKTGRRQIASPLQILTMTGWVRRSTAIIMRGR